LVRFMRASACSILLATLGQLVGAATIPQDFELKARFFPGGSWTPDDWNPWNLTIHADGKAIQITNLVSSGTDRQTVKTIQLSQPALGEIISAFRKCDFLSLPKEITQPLAEHQMGLSLRLTSEGRSHSVTFSVPANIRDRSAARRFWGAWNVV